MKFAVGLMLVTFGTFWGGEGAGVAWPGGEAAILGVLAVTLPAALLLVAMVRSRAHRLAAA
jgi:uncharacterized membrane protein